jgi:WD40 repeat protein
MVVDQFEECFTVLDDAERSVFIDRLLDAFTAGRLRWLALAIRGDYYADCALDPRLAGLVGPHTMLLGPPNRAELIRMVEGPANVAGLRLEPALSEAVVADVAAEPSPLPLLSHALLETWRRRRGDRLTLADYRAAGGALGAIAASAERVFTSELGTTEQRLARNLLLRLVDPGGDRTATRTPADLSELRAAYGPAVDGVLDVLVAARLVVVDENRVELAHEALVDAWPRLRHWLDDDRERLRTIRHLSTAAREWRQRGSPDADLYRGARLDAAIAFDDGGEMLTPTEHEFITASIAGRDSERRTLLRTNRRLRRLLIAAVSGLVIAVIGGALAVVQQQAATRARRRADSDRARAEQTLRSTQITQLADNARTLASTNIDLASLLALEAVRLEERADTLGGLEDVLRAVPAVSAAIQLSGLPAEATFGASSLDGRQAVFVAPGELVPVALPSFTASAPIPIADVTSVAISPHNDRLAVITRDGVETADLQSGQIGPLLAAGNLTTMMWTDDTHLAAGALGGGLDLIDVAAQVVQTVNTNLDVPDQVSLTVASDSTTQLIATAPQVKFSPSFPLVLRNSLTGQPIGPPIDVPAGGPTSLQFQPGGHLLAIGTLDEGVLMFDIQARAFVDTPTRSLLSATPTFSPDGRRLAILDNGGAIAVYDASTWRPVLSRIGQDAHAGSVARFSPTGDQLYLTRDRQTLVLDLDGRQPLATPPFGQPGLKAGAVRSDGRQVFGMSFATNADNSTWSSIAYDPDTGHQTGARAGAVFSFSGDQTWTMAVDGQGRLAATTPDGAVLGVSAFGRHGNEPVAQSRDGSLLVTAQPDQLVTWFERTPGMTTVATGVVANGTTLTGLTLSDDGRLVARVGTTDSPSGQLVDITDVASGKILSRLTLPSEPAITITAFASDAQKLAIGDDGGNIGVLDIASGRFDPQQFRGIRGAVTSALGFTPDGARLLAAGTDGTIWWWDVASHQPIGEPITTDLQGFLAGNSDALNYDSTMHHLLIASSDGLRLWNFDTTTWPAIACERAGRNLTQEEWRRYIPAGEPYHVTCPQYPTS